MWQVQLRNEFFILIKFKEPRVAIATIGSVLMYMKHHMEKLFLGHLSTLKTTI